VSEQGEATPMASLPPGRMAGRDQRGAKGQARRVLVVCFDPIDGTMAGPAIRAWELAELLAADHCVTLASTVGATRSHPAMTVTHLDGPDLDAAAVGADVIFAPISVARRHPGLVASGVPLAIDIYIPTHLENLEPAGREIRRHLDDVAHQVDVIGDDLAVGDFFVCASERQRDFWLGALASAGRVNPLTTGGDPGLRRLIDVVAFGLPSTPPVPAGSVLRDRFGIGAADPVLIWGGGVYEWLDPLVMVRAVARLTTPFPAVHLVFLGMRNPNPGIVEMPVAARLRALSAELGLTGTHVHFNESWVPYDDRGAWLLDANVAVSMHSDHLETRFSFRTRVLDYLWARRPMVLTGGDELSETVAAAGLGVTVAPGDDEAVADAVTRLLTDPPRPDTFDAVAANYRWPAVAAPLLAWCADPAPAPDRARPAPHVARLRAAAVPSAPSPAVPAFGSSETADAVARTGPLAACRLVVTPARAVAGRAIRIAGRRVSRLGGILVSFGRQLEGGTGQD
jgi:glycosyltransferase involved in cell wall biosynthesis